MANHKSAVKRNRQSLRRRDRNRTKKSEIYTVSKKALLAEKPEEAATLFRLAQKKIAKAAKSGALHWKTAARKVSRLSKAIKAKHKAA